MLENNLDIEHLFDELFPIPRSITGDGYRKSLQIISRFIPFEIERTLSGSKVFDWIVPPEWGIDDAYLMDPTGEKILDFKKNNLVVVNYSEPIDKIIEFEELDKNLHSIPDHPDWIPYVTSYYKRNWGFCITHRQRQELRPGKYHAVIKSSFVDGAVEYGYKYLRGSTASEVGERKLILISSYLCHPSLANNELSGPIILAALYERIAKWKNRRFDYLFVINPETIGSICFLHKHGEKIAKSMQDQIIYKDDSILAINTPITSNRIKEVLGTHSVTYNSSVDEINITHTATNRDGFAMGAIIAAEWIIGRKGVFSMKDVLVQ